MANCRTIPRAGQPESRTSALVVGPSVSLIHETSYDTPAEQGEGYRGVSGELEINGSV